MTRIASSPFEMWRDICATNAEAIQEAIALFQDALSGVSSRLQSEQLAEDFSFAQRVRAEIPKDSKGFLTPLHELRLMVEDRPGVIGEIGSALAESGVNIRDIEVLKVREGEGGSLRLAFGTGEDAASASRILRGIGFKVLV